MGNNNSLEPKYKVIGFIITIILLVMFWNWLSSDDEDANSKPSELDLMSYAQTVLDDNMNNPKYSRNQSDYKFVGTDLRYKIEGKVNGENFWMIIQFVDNNYKEYDLISLQVGNKTIYKKY